MKTTKVLLNIVAFVCFLYGALYLFTLVFIPIGVYCLLAAKRFAFKAEHLYDTYTVSNQTLKNFTIFVSIACFPLGLLAVIQCYLLVSNKIKISEFKVSSSDYDEVNRIESDDVAETIVEEKKEEVKTESKTEKVENKEEPVQEVETEEEKQEKFNKLLNFKEKGIITEEELEMAREQLFGKKQ